MDRGLDFSETWAKKFSLSYLSWFALGFWPEEARHFPPKLPSDPLRLLWPHLTAPLLQSPLCQKLDLPAPPHPGKDGQLSSSLEVNLHPFAPWSQITDI